MDPKIKTKKRIHKRSSQVPGQYLGYSLQATRFLVRLLKEDEDFFVSLEVFEDVGLEGPKGYKTLEQDKSTYNSNPLHDRSVDLWKTFSNWLTAIEAGELIIDKTFFEIYISHPKAGTIIQSFSNAKTYEEAQKTLKQVKTLLWGSDPNHPLKDKVPKGARKYIDHIFNADEALISKLIQSFTLSSGTGSPHQELKNLLGKSLIVPEFLDDVLKYALGWVKEQTDLLLEKRKPAVISVKAFRTNLSSFVRKLCNRAILNTFAKARTQDEINIDLRLKTYVRQLDIIESDDSSKIRAVTDFLKAASDRTQWSKKGLVNESSFDEFEEGLIRTWENLKKKTTIILPDRNEVQKGQYLYAECSSHEAKLEGMQVPSHFTAGSFHALSDDQMIGWHPDYKNKIKNIKRRES